MDEPKKELKSEEIIEGEPSSSPEKKGSVAKKVAKRIFLYLVVFQVIVSLGLYFFQLKLIYIPHGLEKYHATPEMDGGMAFEEIEFLATDGAKLWGWYVTPPKSRGVVLYCHGNAGNITHRTGSIRLFYELGYTVFIFDYRGYGKSQGSPNEQGTYWDVEGAWKFLAEKKGHSPSDIVVFGRSLGGAVASYIAEKHTPKALLLESTFTSLPDVAAEIYPWLLLVRVLSSVEYPTGNRLANIKCPIMITHSPQDEIIPYSHGEALYKLAKEPKRFLKIEGGHNVGFRSNYGKIQMTVAQFLNIPEEELPGKKKIIVK